VTDDTRSGDNAENANDDDVLKLSFRHCDDRLFGRVGCGYGFVIVHVLEATKHYWNISRRLISKPTTTFLLWISMITTNTLLSSASALLLPRYVIQKGNCSWVSTSATFYNAIHTTFSTATCCLIDPHFCRTPVFRQFCIVFKNANNVEATFDRVKAAFDTVAFDNVAPTLLLLWMGLEMAVMYADLRTNFL